MDVQIFGKLGLSLSDEIDWSKWTEHEPDWRQTHKRARKNIPNIVPYRIVSLPARFPPPLPPHQKPHFHDKDRKTPRGASWLNTIKAFTQHLGSEEEGKPASSQEALTEDSQRINRVGKNFRSGGVWNHRRPRRPCEWVGWHKPAGSSKRRPPDYFSGETEEEGGRAAAAAESVMAGPRQKQQPIR